MVGINVAYIPPKAVSIGFAIPSPTVIDVVTQLLDDGEATHAYLEALFAGLRGLEPGQEVDLTVARDGQERVLQVEVEDRPDL